jgi:hypothetical protein
MGGLKLTDVEKQAIERRIDRRLERERERHRHELSAAIRAEREQHARELTMLRAELARLQSERSVFQRLADRWFPLRPRKEVT